MARSTTRLLHLLILQSFLIGLSRSEIPDNNTSYYIRANDQSDGCLASLVAPYTGSGNTSHYSVTLDACSKESTYSLWKFNTTINGTYNIWNVGVGPQVELGYVKGYNGSYPLIQSWSGDNNRGFWNMSRPSDDIVQFQSVILPGYFVASTLVNDGLPLQNDPDSNSTSWNLVDKDTMSSMVSSTVSSTTSISIISPPVYTNGTSNSDNSSTNEGGHSPSTNVAPIIGATMGSVIGLALGIFLIWFCRYRRAILSAHKEAEETRPLLQQAKINKDGPRTQQTISAERQSLIETVYHLEKLKQTLKIRQQIFLCLQGLIENWLDGLTLSTSSQYSTRALNYSEKCISISQEIQSHRPSAPSIAHFYKGQVLLTYARLLEHQQSLSDQGLINWHYEKAFNEFILSKTSAEKAPNDYDAYIYSRRSVHFCAFIALNINIALGLEQVLLFQSDYESAKAFLRLNQGRYIEALVELDKNLLTGSSRSSVSRYISKEHSPSDKESEHIALYNYL
ncbi:hypothetical protein BX600DRAFT_435616 [Xylariales sp. PMI_506]|nr:hypothetical protein BX600DRAFT_435616 [Xylariales sp. PMI_506]